MYIGQENINEQYSSEEMDQFQLLENKVDHLIKFINSLKEEKMRLEDKIKEQEKTINELKQQLEKLEIDRDKAKERISYVLSKIDQIDTQSHGE